MPDISHQFGSDLAVSPSGDIATVSGPALTLQRTLKRLLTNPGDYIWHLGYGAGLASFVGQPTNITGIAAVIRSQIFKEAQIARSPEPVIDIQTSSDGSLYVHIRYSDTTSGATQILSFSVGA
jgi:hypothetical protein